MVLPTTCIKGCLRSEGCVITRFRVILLRSRSLGENSCIDHILAGKMIVYTCDKGYV